jgi:hypothetical protein
VTLADRVTFGTGEQVWLRQADLRLVLPRPEAFTPLPHIPDGVYIPVPRGQKHTTVVAWQGDPPPSMQIGPNDNRALRLDHPLVDADLDCAEACHAAVVLLLNTAATFGRPSMGVPTHYLYRADNLRAETFEDVNGQMLVELRSGRTQYTLIPPSLLPADQGKPLEVLRWIADGDLASVDSEGLRHSVRSVATAALLARHWPVPGSRHEVAGLAAGFLAHAGLDAHEVALIIEQAATIANDAEVADRIRFARETCEKFADGKRVTGSRKLATVLGEPVAKRLRDWYGTERRTEVPEDAFTVTEIDLKLLTPEVWRRIRDANNPPRLFLQGGSPVRIARVPEHRKRKLPTVVLQPIGLDVLRRQVADTATFYQAGRGGPRQVPPPDGVSAAAAQLSRRKAASAAAASKSDQCYPPSRDWSGSGPRRIVQEGS